jgi:hypothetical protein
MDTVVRLARNPYRCLHHHHGEGGGGGGGVFPAVEVDRGRRAARLLNPAPRAVDPEFFGAEPFIDLAEPVQTALRVILALVPHRAGDAKRLIEDASFGALTPDEQYALLRPPRPDRLEAALAMLSHPGWYSLPEEKLPLLELDPKTRSSMLSQLEHFPSLATGRYFVELARTPWFREMSPEDRVRSAKIIAFASSAISGSTFEDLGVSQRKIIENSVESLVGPTPRFDLVLRDLPFDEHETVAGQAVHPRTLILNRLAIPADDRPIAGVKQEHVALMTLVHEVNHLANQIPEGPTYASFQDEYRAWFVAFVAFMSRMPTRIEGLTRVKELFANPSYADIQQALDGGGDEAAKIVAFMRGFGRDLDTRDRIAAYQPDTNLVLSAPLPEPMLEMNNGSMHVS